MIARNPFLGAAYVALALAGCTTTTNQPISSSVQTEAGACQTEGVKLDTDFPAGNVASCAVTGANQFTVTLKPEDAPPINCSAWYAFRLTPDSTVSAPQKITVKLNYEACGHRYWPKTSTNGTSWDYVSKNAVKTTEVGDIKQASVSMTLDDKPIFVAGQEIFVPATYRAWIDETAASENVEKLLLGKSAEGRDIPAMTIKNPGTSPKQQVVLIGRQHPPEITGALALLPFVETLLADTPLAKRYRSRFETVVVPMLNPDGVVRGHWRHNTGSTDLNRDWGPFKQPETQLMDGLLQKIEDDPNKQLSFFADFHSTQNDIFYTIPDELPTKPALFIKNWLGLLQERMPDYKVKRSVNPILTQANSKNYVYKRYGVPTVTYEMGDETDRELIKKIAQEAAVAMMETLLASEAE